jgi:hypothetical protein
MGCCVWVCSVWFMGKMQGFWFSMYGLPGEDVGKETRPKGAFGLRKEWWLFAVIATVVILCCDSNNGERMKFVVFVYGSVFGFWEKIWVCCGWFFLGVWVCCGWMGCLPMGFGLHRAWEHRLQSTRSTRKKMQHKIYAIIITTN